MMGGSILQIIACLIVGGLLGGLGGLYFGATISKRRIAELRNASRTRLAELTHQKTQMAAEVAKARSKNKSLRAAIARVQSKLESSHKKTKILAKNVLTLRDERENTKVKVTTLQKALDSIKQQTLALQGEFEKAGKFYKGELTKSFEKRKVLQKELEEARGEQEAFAKRVESSVLEHGSPEEMITAAQLRLGQLDVLERNVSKLEAENTELRNDAKRMKQEYDALEKDLSELDELRINNQQLVRCVESLENSRQKHEHDAERYRDQADESERLSDTLRLKLDDLEKNFASMEHEQQQAIQHVRKTASQTGEDGEEVVDFAKYSEKR